MQTVVDKERCRSQTPAPLFYLEIYRRLRNSISRIKSHLKAYAKAHNYDKNYDPYKAAGRSMPSHAAADPEIEQMYIDGHFCRAFKIGIVTNGPALSGIWNFTIRIFLRHIR